MYRWIKADVFTSEQLRGLLRTSLDQDHLFYGLGEKGTNSVFTRAFAVLIIPLVVGKHLANPFLEQEEISHAVNRVLDYMDQEKDIRGYVYKKGWAHAIAHGADAIDELALVPTVTKDELNRMLTTIQLKFLNTHEVFLDEEEERMTTAIVSIMDRHVFSRDELTEWIEGFANHVTRETCQFLPEHLLNIKLLLQALINRLMSSGSEYQSLIPVIQTTKKKLYA
ncbi:DUF2785 domain-containing protein [Paenibacillus sp. N1-5-1-14]|nr:DUF2785 domain-containing protein [Paenibacillus radicibacter]